MIRMFCSSLRIQAFIVYSFETVNCMEVNGEVSLVKDCALPSVKLGESFGDYFLHGKSSSV